jgi:nicotinamidase/pyrazinamidase
MALFVVRGWILVKNIFFADIDTQRDFILPGGAMYVPGAERIIPKLRRLFDFAKINQVQILSSLDSHADDDPEFQQFPVHCIRGTEGQRKLDETLLPHPLILKNEPIDRNLVNDIQKYQQIIIEKQTLDVFSNPVTERLLKALPSRAIVFGVAMEYCVQSACSGLRRNGVQTVVITDAVRAVSPVMEKKVFEEMKKAGVEFTTLDVILEICGR